MKITIMLPLFTGMVLLLSSFQMQEALPKGEEARLLFNLSLSAKEMPKGPLKDWDETQALKALTQWFRKRQYPLPPDPDAMVTLPGTPLMLDGIPDLLRLVDLLRLKNPGDRIPLRVDAGLAIPSSWAKRRPWMAGGSWWFEDLLPESPLPKGRLVRPVPRGVLLSRTQAPSSLAKFFAQSFLLFVQPSLRSEVRVRVAIELASLQVPDWQKNLNLIAKSRKDLGNAILLCQAVSYALGGKDAASPPLFQDWFRLFSHTTGDAKFYFGLALRRSLRLNRLPKNVDPGLDAWATLLAGLRPGGLLKEITAKVQGSLSPKVESALVLCLARGSGKLSKDLTKLAMERCFGQDRVPLGNLGNRRAAAWLLLLMQRNPGALRKAFPRFEPGVCGGDLRRGKLFGRNLSRLGKEFSMRILDKLSHRKTLEAGDLGLLSALDSFGVPGLGLTLEEIRKTYQTQGVSPMGRVLLDLGIGEIRLPNPPTKDMRTFLGAAFKRLLQYQASPLKKPDGWHKALGKALGQILLLLPRGPSGRPAPLWLATWIQNKSTREMGMKAFEVGIKRRSSLFRDSLGQLNQVKVGRIESLRILGRWNRLALRNPLPSGTSLWSPLDPLLGDQELEFDLPLTRR